MYVYCYKMLKSHTKESINSLNWQMKVLEMKTESVV